MRNPDLKCQAPLNVNESWGLTSFRKKLLSNSSKSSILAVSLQQTTVTAKEMPLQKNFEELKKYKSICIHWNINISLHSAFYYWLLFHCVILSHDLEQAPLTAAPTRSCLGQWVKCRQWPTLSALQWRGAAPSSPPGPGLLGQAETQQGVLTRSCTGAATHPWRNGKIKAGSD